MKKLIAMLLAVAMVFGLVACGGNSEPAATEAPAADAPAAAEMTAAEKAAAEAEIRYALGLLLDRNYVVEEITQAGQLPASSFVAKGQTDADGSQFYENSGNSDEYVGYYDVSKEAFEANYAEAYEILTKYYEVDENGMFTNFPSITYTYNTGEAHKAVAEYLQSALAAVGINIQLENQEWNTFLNTRKNGDYTFARNAWVSDYNDPICFLDMWLSNSGNNDIQVGKGEHKDLAVYSIDLTDLGLDIKVENGTWAETYDVIINLVKTSTDNDLRFALMHKAEDLLMSTGAITPIYFYTDPYMLDASVEGFYANPLGYKYFHKTTVDGKNDTIAVCVASEPDTLDPSLNSALDGAIVTSHLFAGLAKWDQDETGKLVISADCAAELPEPVVNEDGTVTYTYTLKEGMTWSNGDALTAADFVNTWKHAASSELGADYGYMFDVVKGYPDDLAVEAIDDTTLVVTLNNMVPYWNELLAFPTYFPVHSSALDNEAWATDPSTYISNGAYEMTAWEHNSVLTLTKNENYHGADNVTMNEIKFYLSDDDNNMLTNFKNGSWQLIDSFPTNEIAAIQAEYTGRADVRDEYIIGDQIGTYYLCWNVNAPLLP